MDVNITSADEVKFYSFFADRLPVPVLDDSFSSDFDAKDFRLPPIEGGVATLFSPLLLIIILPPLLLPHHFLQKKLNIKYAISAKMCKQ